MYSQQEIKGATHGINPQGRSTAGQDHGAATRAVPGGRPRRRAPYPDWARRVLDNAAETTINQTRKETARKRRAARTQA